MFAIDDATAVAVMPTPEAAGIAGFFTEGNPSLGVAATYLRASFLNALMQEMLNILTAAGVTPSKTVYDQLLTSFRSNALLVANDTGPANGCAIAYTPAITTLADGMVLWFKAAATNTGATTLAVNAVGVKNLVGGAHQPLQGGEIVAGGKCMVVWNAAIPAFVLVECTGAALQVGTATKSQHALQLGQATGRLIRTLIYTRVSGVQNVSIDGGAPTTTGATTYVPSAAATYIIGEAQGGGNPGGGALTTTTGLISMGSPGGAGAYGKGRYSIASVGASQTITVGAAGTQNAGAAGGAGGSSSIGTLLSAPGGLGSASQNGITSGPVIFGNNSQTAAPTGANLFWIKGGCNNSSICANNGSVSGFLGGTGGFSLFGVGGAGSSLNAAASAASGNYGTGGGGVFLSQTSPTVTGGAATDGVVIIQEFA